jgi:hypothetical protein
MLYQHVRPPFWRRHPVITATAALGACWLVIHGSYVLVAVGAALGLVIYVKRRRRALAVQIAGLRARADYEYRLTLAGDPRGWYGRYPPVSAGWFPDPQNPWLLRYFDGVAWTPYTVQRYKVGQ